MFKEADPAANQTSIGEVITAPLNKRPPIVKSKVKWIDDLSVCASVSQQSLVPEDCQVPLPVSYHNRTGHRQATLYRQNLIPLQEIFLKKDVNKYLQNKGYVL